jgi:long-chain acyl-CoA synthetase
MNIAKNLERSAFYFPERPAVCEGSSSMTYGQLNERAARTASALLQMGLKPNEHVGLCGPNSGEWLSFYFGVLKAGGVPVTLSSLLKSAELNLLVNHARPRFFFTFGEKLNDLAGLRGPGMIETVISPDGDMEFSRLLDKGLPSFSAVERERTDTAAILYTGGTTGIPKGVMLSHENINAAIHTVVYNERSTPEDRALCFLPLNHVFGQMHIMNSTILSGGCLEILPAFDMEKILSLMANGRVTKLYSVPTIFVRLLSLDRLRERLGSVRYSFSAAASMAAELVRQWKERTGLAVYEGYGMTEAAPTVTYNHYHRHVIGSVGTEVPGVEVQTRDESGNVLQIGETGEICARGPNIMKGYLDNPEGTEAAFWPGKWLRTGDVGIFDADGYLYIVDRVKDMIITGGENVYPREVEEVLYTMEGVEECAVIGLPDKEWGERVTAFIIPRQGRELDTARLHAQLKSRLSPFKVPKEYRVVSDFPKNPAGKILKRELKKSVEEPEWKK